MSTHRYFIQAIEKPGSCFSPGGSSVQIGLGTQLSRLGSEIKPVRSPHPAPPLVFLHSWGFIPLLWFNDIPPLSVFYRPCAGIFVFIEWPWFCPLSAPYFSPGQLAPSLTGSLTLPWDAIDADLLAAVDWSKGGHLTQAGPMTADSLRRMKLWSAGWGSCWCPCTLEKD